MKPSPLLLRFLVCVLAWFAGCTKPVDLPDLTVNAASPGDFARFRSDLGTRFTPDQLKDFDIATLELQLDAMNRDIATAADREADMLRVANGKTVHAVTLLGWQARKARFSREIAEITRMLDLDLAQQAKAAANGAPESVTRRIGSEREVLAKLQAGLAATEAHLTELEDYARKPRS